MVSKRVRAKVTPKVPKSASLQRAVFSLHRCGCGHSFYALPRTLDHYAAEQAGMSIFRTMRRFIVRQAASRYSVHLYQDEDVQALLRVSETDTDQEEQLENDVNDSEEF